MGLTRIYSGATGLGQVIIRRLTDVGGAPASRVSEELDRLYAWAKDSPRRINFNFAQVGNVGGGEDDLHSHTVAANSLATNGDSIWFYFAGTNANTANNKTWRVRFNATQIGGGVATYQNLSYRIVGNIARIDSDSVKTSIHHEVISSSVNSIVNYQQVDSLDFSTSLVLKMTGESAGAATDDVICQMSEIFLVQQ
jgi:hypothetical protein